jgi:putative serine/threonine protein kinase
MEGLAGLSEFIEVSRVLEYKVGEFLCWPHFDEDLALDRLKQLISLRVEGLAVGGPHNVLGTPVLGKGHAGIVIRALWRGKEVALKVRRSDADRVSMEKEAEYLEHVNKWCLGPVLYGFTRDFIVMEKIDGRYLGDWVKANIENRELVKEIIKDVLDIAFRLDQSGLDHGELTRIRRHYIVTRKGPRVIDFESASFNRTPSNVTSTVQSLFLNIRFRRLLDDVFQLPGRDTLLTLLRKYKKEPSENNYQDIVNILVYD